MHLIVIKKNIGAILASKSLIAAVIMMKNWGHISNLPIMFLKLFITLQN